MHSLCEPACYATATSISDHEPATPSLAAVSNYTVVAEVIGSYDGTVVGTNTTAYWIGTTDNATQVGASAAVERQQLLCSGSHWALSCWHEGRTPQTGGPAIPLPACPFPLCRSP